MIILYVTIGLDACTQTHLDPEGRRARYATTSMAVCACEAAGRGGSGGVGEGEGEGKGEGEGREDLERG